MAYFAVPKNGIIENIIVASTKEDADISTGVDCVEYTKDEPIFIGFVFDDIAQKWVPAEPVV
jgi:hypothetical protein